MGKKRVLVGYGGKYSRLFLPIRSDSVIYNSRRGRCVGLVFQFVLFFMSQARS